MLENYLLITDNFPSKNETIIRLNIAQNSWELLLETDPQVWTPTEFSLAMAELIASDDCQGKLVMDIATGSGILGIVAGKKKALQVIMSDLNPQSIAIAQRNWVLNGLKPESMQIFHSDCFTALKSHSQKKGKIDLIYSNPPTFPDIKPDITSKKSQQISSADWNRNGKRGRLVIDALICQGKEFLKPGGEMLFIATSKQGIKTTLGLMEKYWGEGIKLEAEDPLDYQIDWQQRGKANWAVIKRLDLPLANYYRDFLPLYQQMIEKENESAPVIEKEGKLYQKLYFIRARKPDKLR